MANEMVVSKPRYPCGKQESARCMQELEDTKPKDAIRLKKQELCFTVKKPC